MTSRLLNSAEILRNRIDLSRAAPRHIGILHAHEGAMLEVAGFPYPIGTTARIATTSHNDVRGEVVGFRGQTSLIQSFENDAAFVTGTPVYSDGTNNMVQCGNALLGRIVDAHGHPLDGGPKISSRVFWPLHGRKSNPLNRARVTEQIEMGVRAIDALLTTGRGQRIAIAAGSGVGKSVLMGQMLAGADCDILVIGLVGERAREVSDFVETKLTGDIARKSVVVAVPADHPPLLRLRAAMRATAIAEYFRAQGKNVLLMIDSLTRIAHAQREIGLALGEPPTMKGYPPSALAIIPRLIERAGADRSTGGCITAIYTVLADGGDHDDPIVDAARAIVDGHIILSRTLAEQGVYPAIDLSRSLSRTMPDLVSGAHMQAAKRFRALWSAYEENRDLLLMGAYVAGNDPVLDAAVERHHELLDFITQGAQETTQADASHAALIDSFGHD